MKDILLTIFHVAVVVAKLLGRGGVRAVIAENLLLKHQLIVLRRPRRRAPNLTVSVANSYSRRGREFIQPSTVTPPHEVAEISACLDGATAYHRGRIAIERCVDPGIIEVISERFELFL